MKDGDICIHKVAQPDGTFKIRPVLLLKQMPPYGDWIVCAILDISCFHFQQAVEKYLKTFLIFHNKDFPKTHNIDLLLKSCGAINDRFEELDVKKLEDFAVALEIKELVLKEIED